MGRIDESKRKRPFVSKGKGRKLSEEHKRNIGLANKVSQIGKRHTIETRRKMSEIKKGVNSHLWRGGITPENRRLRMTSEYKIWRESVFKRDNYTCVWCSRRRCELNADHIKPFAYFPELRFAIDNGRTLCKSCHEKTDTYRKRIWK